jgi:hypothetical protein
MAGSHARSTRLLRIFLEFIVVVAGSILAGFLIGTLQHYLSFGARIYGFGKESFWLACFGGGGLGGILGVPVGISTYYVILKRHITNRQVAIIILGTLVGGSLAGIAVFWVSAFITPILALLIAFGLRYSLGASKTSFIASP